MINNLEKLPLRFRDIDFADTHFDKSSRVVEPVCRLHRTNGQILFNLSGQRTVQGEPLLIDAPTARHNWVLDSSVIRPLPHDTPDRLRDLLSGVNENELSFVDVVRLIRITDPPIRIHTDQSVFVAAKLEAATETDALAVDGLNASLYPYQAGGVRWMRETIRHTGGLILADEMGLGKTIQIIALLLSDPPTSQSPALIICPTSLLANWRQEIFRFAPELSVMIHRGAHRTGISGGLQRAQVVITTYDTLVNDQSIFRGVFWSWLICDEAQAVKNPDAYRREALASVPRQRTIPMTGTPVETSLLDLWSLTDLAIPGLLGERDEFEENFPDNEDSASQLARLTDPIVLRRRVADVAEDLPERIDVDVPLELGPVLSKRYTEVLDETIEKYPRAGALVATGQLQLFCAHPWLQSNSSSEPGEDVSVNRKPDLPLMTPKLERAIALLDEAFRSGRKVLIFAVFNKCGDLIREAGRDLPSAYWGEINGSTPQEERQKIVETFSEHTGPGCLVLNPKAAGAGLNITAATLVIHFTQAWNPALEAQASARAHRRGQTQPVTIYRLFYEDTVERIMIERSEWRRDLGNEAVPVSTREIEDLSRALNIRPGAGDD